MGAGLLKNAFLRAISAAEIAVARTMIVTAKDGRSRDFYMKFGFVPYVSDGFHLYLLMKTIRDAMK